MDFELKLAIIHVQKLEFIPLQFKDYFLTLTKL